MDHFDRVETSLKGTTHEKRDVSILSETTLHSCYVAFECLISDLTLAYINRDTSQYQHNLKTKIDSSIRNKFGTWAASRTTFSPLKHITIEELETILDPDDFNLTFKDVATLKQKYLEWVAAPHKNAVIAINDPDTKLLDTAHALRNFIAHGTTSAQDKMNQCLATIATGPASPNYHLQRGPHEIHDVGAYLKSVTGGSRRIKRLISRLKSIAASL